MRREILFPHTEIGRVIVKSFRIGDEIALDVQLRVITFVTICKIKFPALSQNNTSDLCVSALEVALLINIFHGAFARSQ